MPTAQQYATNVPQVTLTAGIGAGTTNFAVTSLSGWPSTPFTAVLDMGLSTQEPIDVISVSGNTITNCTRAIDGTAAFAHSSGATFTHADIGRDFREARAHIDALGPSDSTGKSVHGLVAASSVVVGTNDTQTLTNKTISAGTFTGAQGMGSGAWTGTGTLVEAAIGASGLTGATAATTRLAGATTSWSPSSGTFATGDMVADNLGNLWVCTVGGTPGTWFPVGSRAVIARLSGSSSSYNVTLPTNNIPNRVEVFWRGGSTAASHFQILNLRFNNDSGTNYQYERLEANNATVASTGQTGQTGIQVATIAAASQTANYRSSGRFVIEGVTQTTVFPTVIGEATAFDTSTNFFNGAYSGQYTATGGITSIQLAPVSGSWDANSTMTAIAVY